MRAYIQCNKDGIFFNVNAYLAYEGFSNYGFEIIPFQSVEDISDLDPSAVLVGGIGNVRKRLEKLSIHHTHEDLDYPKELYKYLGRKVWATTVEDIFQNHEPWNFFIKPKDFTKKFTGKVVTEFKDFIGLTNTVQPTPIWCSEVVKFQTEWRCFVRYGKILDIRRYKGRWDTAPDLSVIQNAIADFTSAPAAYGIDFGIDEQGVTKLVEVNDGHSLGGYGISSANYALLLSARWAELTNTQDSLEYI